MKNFFYSIFSYTVINLFPAKILMNLELGDIAHDPDDIGLVETTNCHEDIQEAILSIEDWSCIEVSTKIDWVLSLTEQYTQDNVLIFSSWYVLVLCYYVHY
jgi:hypothetical protein